MVEQFFKVDPMIMKEAEAAEERCREAFARIDRITEYNACKVL